MLFPSTLVGLLNLMLPQRLLAACAGLVSADSAAPDLQPDGRVALLSLSPSCWGTQQYMYVQVGHVDVASNSLVDVRHWNQREAQEELGSMADLQGCWQPVESLLKHLQALHHGHYLLSFVPASGCICILKAWAGPIIPQVGCRTMGVCSALASTLVTFWQ